MMIRSGHNFAHGTTAELSWHVQSYGLTALSKTCLKQNEFSQDFNFELILLEKWITTDLGVGRELWVRFPELNKLFSRVRFDS